MGRNRTFDEEAVLGAAMNLFRREGYARVSIKDLETATGLSSGSLYNAFGDKDGLYRAALSFYVDTFVRGRVDAYAGPEACLETIEQLLLSVLRLPLADGYGCLVTNAAVEFGPTDSIATPQVQTGLDLVEDRVRDALARELGSDMAELEAKRLMLFYQGILVLSRARRLTAVLEQVIRTEFDRLKGLREQRRVSTP